MKVASVGIRIESQILLFLQEKAGFYHVKKEVVTVMMESIEH